MSDANWTCRCGAFAMRVQEVPASGTPATCYCTDCRAFAYLHGDAGALDPAGGVALYTTTPDRIDIVRGSAHLACERLTPRGPLRWFTTCCDTPVGNGAPLRGVPFFSVQAARLADAPSKPAARLHRGSATGHIPRPRGNTYALVMAVAKRGIASRLSGRWTRTPFFGADGQPVARPATPDAATLRTAYRDAR